MAKTTSNRTYAGRISVAASARAVLRGELDQVGLSTVLTMMEMERRTGLLVVKHGRQTARIEVRDGQVLRARMESARGPEGAEAIYQALAWMTGQFQLFAVKVAARAEDLAVRTTFLLMEGMRRIDEARGQSAPPVGANDFAV